jgi:hypothetical protein
MGAGGSSAAQAVRPQPAAPLDRLVVPTIGTRDPWPPWHDSLSLATAALLCTHRTIIPRYLVPLVPLWIVPALRALNGRAATDSSAVPRGDGDI